MHAFACLRHDTERRCRGGLSGHLYAPEIELFEAINTSLRAVTTNSRGEYLPEWCVSFHMLMPNLDLINCHEGQDNMQCRF